MWIQSPFCDSRERREELSSGDRFLDRLNGRRLLGGQRKRRLGAKGCVRFGGVGPPVHLDERQGPLSFQPPQQSRRESGGRKLLRAGGTAQTLEEREGGGGFLRAFCGGTALRPPGDQRDESPRRRLTGRAGHGPDPSARFERPDLLSPPLSQF